MSVSYSTITVTTSFDGDLKAGDLLSYGVPETWYTWLTDPFYRTVQQVTKSPVCHVEVYIGNGLSISADYRGVGIYPVDSGPAKPYGVHRITSIRPDVTAGMAWFRANAQGKPYDTLGLVMFGRKQPDYNKFICSELALDFYRHSWPGFVMAGRDAKTVTPGELINCGLFSLVRARGYQR